MSNEADKWCEAAADLARCFASANERIAELEGQLSEAKQNLACERRTHAACAERLSLFEKYRPQIP